MDEVHKTGIALLGIFAFLGLAQTVSFDGVIAISEQGVIQTSSNGVPQTVNLLGADFQLSGVSDSGKLKSGEILDVSYTVTNEGSSNGTQDIVLEVEGVQEDVNSSVYLDPADSSSGVLNWDTSGFSSGTYNYQVLTDNDFADGTVEIQKGGGTGN